MNLNTPKNIYLLGIKGAGMTALAQILKKMGKNVWGSDEADYFFTEEVLKQEKIKVLPFAAKNITQKIDLLIYSTAYNEKNKEFAVAKGLGLPMISYPEALGLLFAGKYSIAVCGAHGKTTTTAMLAYVLQELGQDPLAIVGSVVDQLGGSARFGKGKYLVVEADEYQNKLKYYNPQAVILTSADFDHPDYFKNQKAYNQVFKDFVRRIPKNGVLVAFTDDKNVKEIVKSAKCKIIEYGRAGIKGYKEKAVNYGGVGALLQTKDGRFIWQQRDLNTKKNPGMIVPFGGKKDGNESSLEALKREMAEEIELKFDFKTAQRIGKFPSHIVPGVGSEIFYLKNIDPKKLVLHEGAAIVSMTLEEALASEKVTIYAKEVILAFQGKKRPYLQLTGEHNVWNATAVLALINKLGLSVPAAKKALGDFKGVKRRFELMGEKQGIKIYDDFAHHPTEIQKMLQGAREKFPQNKIWAVFQSHTYTRTKALLKDFGRSFKNADQVVVLPIFGSAREVQGTIKVEALVKEINKNSRNASYHGKIEEVIKFLATKVKKGDVVICIGAGENWRVGKGLLENVKFKYQNEK